MRIPPQPEPLRRRDSPRSLFGPGGWLQILLVVPCLAVLLPGCQTVSFYAQAASGQLSLLGKRQPIDNLITAPATPSALKRQLELVLELRAFAEDALQLPLNGQYRDYADLRRDYVVWNVFVAPELSLQPETWCFPIAGCVAYRGYFNEQSARDYADGMAARGFDTYVAGVTAYSTLGWMRDPVLNTFVFLPEPQLADLIFHELAHQLLYVPGDSLFNESFATTVAVEGVRRWLHARGAADQYATYLESLERQRDFVGLLARYRESLENVYLSDVVDTEKRREKTRLITSLRDDYAQLEESWGGVPVYRAWIDGPVNNAKLNAVSLYYGMVLPLQRLLAREDNDLPSFYRRCRQLAELDNGARRALLQELGPEPFDEPAAVTGD
jgi:predicted aminopeptidase